MDFYDEVTAVNAVEWYRELPPHLRRIVDNERAKYKSGLECSSNEHSDIYNTVRAELGPRPIRPADPADPLEGHTQKQIEQFERLKQWANKYDELLLVKIILENAKNIQKDRMLLSQAMGINNNGLPNQAEGLDPVQAATIAWIQNSGETPLELLTRIYRDENAKMGDRLSAARSLMDYVHRRVPQKQEIETKDTVVPKLDPKVLKGLSDKDIETLTALLGKINGG